MDTFTFQVAADNKPFTRRGVLSTINNLFDPLGLVAPVSVQGRFILRELTLNTHEWDASIPMEKYAEWQKWTKTLKDLEELKIPRLHTALPVSTAQKRELCVFCDASNKAIGAVAYLKVTDAEGKIHVGFIFGKAKLAPKPELTLPRLELCAAVLAVEIAEIITEELDTPVDDTKFFTDSKVVPAYIFNESRRFYVYVHNQVHRIRHSTQASQWHYVPTSLNPADHATRPLSPNQLALSSWFTCPAFLSKSFTEAAKDSSCHGWHVCSKPLLKEQLDQAKARIICTVQKDVFADEIECIEKGSLIRKHSPLAKLCPFVDSQGVLRVGGRLRRAQFTQDEMHPAIIPGRHHITKLLIRHYHQQVHHQGRHFTEGSIRTAGFWIVGGKRAINKVIHNCVICRRLRGKTGEQKMGDLPVDRLSTEPPFTYVGLDIFGPWSIVSRRTRGGCANRKCWAVIFTCMSTKAIHIEVVERMEASSFINALRRFFAIRGAAKQLRLTVGLILLEPVRNSKSQLKLPQQGGRELSDRSGVHVDLQPSTFLLIWGAAGNE
ncbi:hypothetical protein NFI96_027576 [Prochilodus magdalenae]|nr:hypothetical protein NFI96_027576 [Prochilodus magdalenae]